jgi:hypothetical protein
MREADSSYYAFNSDGTARGTVNPTAHEAEPGSPNASGFGSVGCREREKTLSGIWKSRRATNTPTKKG